MWVNQNLQYNCRRSHGSPAHRTRGARQGEGREISFGRSWGIHNYGVLISAEKNTLRVKLLPRQNCSQPLPQSLTPKLPVQLPRHPCLPRCKIWTCDITGLLVTLIFKMSLSILIDSSSWRCSSMRRFTWEFTRSQIQSTEAPLRFTLENQNLKFGFDCLSLCDVRDIELGQQGVFHLKLLLCPFHSVHDLFLSQH